MATGHEPPHHDWKRLPDERRTSNVELRTLKSPSRPREGGTSKFDVERSKFDVR